MGKKIIIFKGDVCKWAKNQKFQGGANSIFEVCRQKKFKSSNGLGAKGQKFISCHQVYLGGVEHSKEELKIIQNMVVAALGPSLIAAEYGAYVMRHLQCFNTVKVLNGHEIRKGDLDKLKFGGYLTLS